MPEAPILSVPPHRRCHARTAGCAAAPAAARAAAPRRTPIPHRAPRAPRSRAQTLHASPADRVPVTRPPPAHHPAHRVHHHPAHRRDADFRLKFQAVQQKVASRWRNSGEKGRTHAEARGGARRRATVRERTRTHANARERTRTHANACGGPRTCAKRRDRGRTGARNDTEEVTQSSRPRAARCALSVPSPPESRRVRLPALSPLASPLR